MYKLYSQLEKRTPRFVKRMIPDQWRTWLGYEVKVNRAPSLRPEHNLSYPLILPEGTTLDAIYDFLKNCHIGNRDTLEERTLYLKEAFRRFLYTLQLVPNGAGELLEIGANPYYMSLLLREFRNYSVSYTNYFGLAFGKGGSETVICNGEQSQFDYANVNIEAEPLPFKDNHFDIVLLCEVLEHLTDNPFYALLEIERVLKPGGWFILTTPNVNRLVNLARMVAGHNIYDPYSGYGPYGRHNREYTSQELDSLLEHAGFQIDLSFTSDVRGNDTHTYMDPNEAFRLAQHRKATLGQYIFVRAQKSFDRPTTAREPEWLYRGPSRIKSG